MQQESPERALQWRLHVRQMFQEYFAKGYRAVDFVLQREAGFGRYLLARGERIESGLRSLWKPRITRIQDRLPGGEAGRRPANRRRSAAPPPARSRSGHAPHRAAFQRDEQSA